MPQKPFGKNSIEASEEESTNIPNALPSHKETRYFDIFMSALPVMAHSINTEGVIQNVSDIWLTKMGYEREEVIGCKSIDFLTKESREYAVKTALPNFFTKESVENIPYELVKKDGSILYVLLSANSWKDQHGLFKGSMATMYDISRHKHLEDALIKSEERYKSAQRMGQVGHWELDLKTDKFWGSDEAKRIYGFDSKRGSFTTSEVEGCIPDRKRVHQALIDLIENRKPYNIEFTIWPHTGHEEKIIKSIAEVVVDESGIPEKVAGVILDITNFKLADQKLRKSEEKYRQLFNSIRDTILVTDTDRNIIDCNQSFTTVFGYTKEEIIGRKTTFLYDSDHEYLEMGKELKSHLNESHFAYTINYRKKSGEVFPGETNAIYMKNDKGQLFGFIGLTRDISYRKMVEESLHKVNDKLKRNTIELEDTNTALKVLLKKRDQDSQDLQGNIYSNYELMVTPFLNKLKNSLGKGEQQNLLDIIETNLNEIVTPFARKLSSPMMSLTSSEIQIATMIKQGYSNKEIATILNSSKRTIDTHRQNIRRKLKLQNKKINLKTYLLNP